VTVADDGHRLVVPDDTALVNPSDARETPDDVTWIDRRSAWGTPFVTEQSGGNYTRERAVALYEGWLRGQIERGELDVEELRGRTLACHCLPKLCHGVVVLNLIAEQADGQYRLDAEWD